MPQDKHYLSYYIVNLSLINLQEDLCILKPNQELDENSQDQMTSFMYVLNILEEDLDSMPIDLCIHTCHF